MEGIAIMTLTEAIKAFQDVQEKYGDVGAHDTEPDGVFQVMLKQAFERGIRKHNLTADQWQLYYGVEGDEMDAACVVAAREMNKAANRCMSLIVDTRDTEHTKSLLKSYLWRVSLNCEEAL